MGIYLNIGMMQSSGENMDFESCIKRIKHDVNELTGGMNRPELVIGTEMAIGRYFSDNKDEMSGDTIPGKVTDILSEIAKEYGIYFMPGSMLERVEKDGKVTLYNSAPIFGPDGRLIDVYRKICPYYPAEEKIERGDRYVTFKIDKKDITIGVMICHDWCFPEISRNLALMGAEILIRPAIDPEGLYEVCKTIPQTRAFENQAYFISLNMSGPWLGGHAYGHTMVAAPDGRVMYEAGEKPITLTMTFDMDAVRDARRYGTCYTEQLMRQLKYFNPPMKMYENLADAPIYKNLPEPDVTLRQRDDRIQADGIQVIGKMRK